MYKNTALLLTLLAAVALITTAARGWIQSQEVANSIKSADVLATVNGVPIHEADVRFALRDGGHDEELPAAHRKNALEVIIRRELISQRAAELGLDANAAYVQKLRRMEAQVNAFKRKALSELFFRQEIEGRASVSEAEAKKHFDENAERIRTELHVWQILLRDEDAAKQVLNDIEHGTPFEAAAMRRFPKLPKTGRKPWNLGYLRWKQVPEPWLGVVYDLRIGEVSGVIRGPNRRFWILKLIDKRQNPDITFESAKPTIKEVLKNEKIESLRKKTDRELRAKANIVYSKADVAAPDE